MVALRARIGTHEYGNILFHDRCSRVVFIFEARLELIPGATKLPPLVNCMSVLRLRLKHLSDDQTGGAGEEDMNLR